jgi:hypothetical protein
MEKIIRKVFFVWEYEKEEQWLNEMSKKGWQLIRATKWKYQFESGPSGEYTYRLELLDKSRRSKESTSYLNFLQETGIEMVGECKQWIYLRCKTADCGFEPNNRALYDLTHLLKIQEFYSKLKNNLVASIAFSIFSILILENFDRTSTVEFLRGFFTGISLAGSFVSLVLIPFTKRINDKVKASIKELYTCE